MSEPSRSSRTTEHLLSDCVSQNVGGILAAGLGPGFEEGNPAAFKQAQRLWAFHSLLRRFVDRIVLDEQFHHFVVASISSIRRAVQPVLVV